MKKLMRGAGGALSGIAFLCYWAAHIIAAVALFKQVKLWAFIVMLCVPYLGDVMAIVCMIKTATWFPFIFYGVYVVLLIIGTALGSAGEE